MNHSIALAALLLVSVSFTAACDVSVDSGANDGGSGGGGGEGGSGESDECTAPKPKCLYDVPSYCKDYGQGPVWECAPTPLVLSFDGGPVAYTEATSNGFDLVGSGERVASDWPTARTPWLALDRDRNGAVDDATELFGSAVRLSSGGRAQNGFEALAELDENADGVIDARDARFGELATWADEDADRRTDAGELASALVGARRLVSIELVFAIAPVCDARGNCGVERARFTWSDAVGVQHHGQVIDVHLPLRSWGPRSEPPP